MYHFAGTGKYSYRGESFNVLTLDAQGKKVGYTAAIRFKPGVSHRSWQSKKVKSARIVAQTLMEGGGKGIPPRPIFDFYMANYHDYIQDRLEYYVVEHYKHYSLKNRLYFAAEAVKRDLVSKVESDSLGLAKNSRKYLKQKMKHRYGSTPFVATGSLLSALEVVYAKR